jgi:integrase
MNVLTETEIGRLIAAYDELEGEADIDERPWWRLARRMTIVALGTAVRRSELLALRWGDLQLLESVLTVRQSFVRGRFTTPKSRASRRTLPLGAWTVETLQEQWRETAFRDDSDLVFGHPLLGRSRGTKTGTKSAASLETADQKRPRFRGLRSSPGWTRTNNPPVNSRMLCQLSYRGTR